MAKPLPTREDLAPYISPQHWAKGLTSSTMQRVIALRREGVNFTTIALGGINLPKRLLIEAYGKLPLELW